MGKVFFLSFFSSRSAIRIDDKHERLWLDTLLTIRYESQTGINGTATSLSFSMAQKMTVVKVERNT